MKIEDILAGIPGGHEQGQPRCQVCGDPRPVLDALHYAVDHAQEGDLIAVIDENRRDLPRHREGGENPLPGAGAAGRIRPADRVGINKKKRAVSLDTARFAAALARRPSAQQDRICRRPAFAATAALMRPTPARDTHSPSGRLPGVNGMPMRRKSRVRTCSPCLRRMPMAAMLAKRQWGQVAAQSCTREQAEIKQLGRKPAPPFISPAMPCTTGSMVAAGDILSMKPKSPPRRIPAGYRAGRIMRRGCEQLGSGIDDPGLADALDQDEQPEQQQQGVDPAPRPPTGTAPLLSEQRRRQARRMPNRQTPAQISPLRRP